MTSHSLVPHLVTMPVPVTFQSLRTPRTVAENKLDLLTQLSAVGFGAFSWETGSVPSGLVEIQASALTDFQYAQSYIANGSLNDPATDEALTQLSDQVYDNQRGPGLYTIGFVRLTDVANAGPYTFSATSVSFSVGPGGLLYNGLYAAATGGTSVTLPKGGAVDVVVQSVAVGVEYAQIGIGALTFFTRGVIPGVSVTNPSNWLTGYAGLQQGTSIETDAQLQDRNRSKWGSLGTGSPEKAYRYWAETADQQVKKCVVYSNFDIFDPGRVDVIIAGSSGPVGPSVVAAVQNYIAPAQIGGERIPETARAVVSSALGHVVTIAATLYVQATYNTAAFQATVLANVAAFFADLAIGALVSQERIVEVLLYPAGLSAGVITDAAITSPLADIQLAYNEVGVPDVTGVVFVSV